MTDGGVLVTGASTGIGEATARHLDSLGWRVFAGVRREVDADRLRAGASARLTPLLFDVTDAEALASAVKAMHAEVGERGLQGVVNNAGIARGGPLEFLELDDWREQLEVNVIGQVAVTKATLPLIRAGRGRIVFIGSMGGRAGSELYGPYCASKFALEGIAEVLRHELRPWKIPVVLIEPGAIKTAIWDKGRALADQLESSLPDGAKEQYRDAVARVRRGMDAADQDGVPAERVAKVVERALVSNRPRARYQVGIDAVMGAVVSRVLPDRLKDAVIRKGTAR